MALREQPYIPLYVQDFLSDEKLRECSAESVGVYIMLMCVLHKQEEYGKLLLLQKDCKEPNKVTNFAMKLARHIPFDVATIEQALNELLEAKVIQIEENMLFQKRMVRDAEISGKRALAGKKGLDSRYSKGKKEDVAKEFATAKTVANSENEIENENEYKIDSEKGGIGGKTSDTLSPGNVPKKGNLKPLKKVFGEYQHVKLSEEQYTRLISDFGEMLVSEYIRRCDEYVQSKGQKKAYNDYNLTLRQWLKRDGHKPRGQPKEEEYDPYSEPIF